MKRVFQVSRRDTASNDPGRTTVSQWTVAPIRRAALFSVVAIGVVGGWLALLSSTWRGTAALHGAIATAEAGLALFAGVIATLRYYTKRDDRFLFVGAGLLSVFVLDVYYVAVTAGVVRTVAAASNRAAPSVAPTRPYGRPRSSSA